LQRREVAMKKVVDMSAHILVERRAHVSRSDARDLRLMISSAVYPSLTA
jgi:hypothetical protein